MPQYKLGNQKGNVLASERERTLASAIRRRASAIYVVQRAFEEAGCSCAPDREQLEGLEARYNSERQRLLESLDKSELGRRIDELREKVKEIDRREHPSLDAEAMHAAPYLAVWLIDQVREGNATMLGSSDHDIASSYAEAWMGGWRPRSLQKPRRSYQSPTELPQPRENYRLAPDRTY